MSVKSGQDALDELKLRLGGPPDSGANWTMVEEGLPFVTAPLPDGFTADPPSGPWLWDASSSVRQLRDPAAYHLPNLDQLNQPPAVGAAQTATREEYCRDSIDVTMRGGTTSGVVYPMAVCELAREYRLRNIGGASAGAIAAAAAAAAEVGRSNPSAEPPPTADERQQGHVRPGFAGFADCMAWLAQVDEDKDSYRVGQLFRPTQQALPIFRLAVAFMRRRLWVIPVLLIGAFGKISKTINLLIGALSLAVIGLWCGRHHAALQYARGHEWTRGQGGALKSVVRILYALTQGAIGLLGLSLLVLGVALLIVRVAGAASSGPPPPAEPIPLPSPSTSWATPVLLTLAGLVLVVLDRWLFGVPLVRLGIVWVFSIVGLTLVAVVSVVRLAGGAKSSSFGLVSGASGPLGTSIWNPLAGLPAATVDRPLVCWLSETISELAGLPTKTPLRFGHLWFGPAFDTMQATDPELARAADDPLLRRTNLELVTSELVQGLSYRFPMPPSAQQVAASYSALYVRKSDLCKPGREIFPPEVVAALTQGAPESVLHDKRTGEAIDDLYRLPEPWDLPVIFAVRMSMALPALLEAVRLYRVAMHPSHVLDDFGRTVSAGTTELRYPDPAGGPWAEELWFSDGGITSNFPIHLFDSLFPMWPTVAINLSPYPPGFGHQDVWVPQDWEGKQLVGAPIDGGMTGFVGAIVDAARGWRDNAQSVMPSYLGRVATVRQSPTEGGTNLFMTRQTIAGLALRGELAGARLRRRFRSAWWQRHQWLRYRTTLGNLSELRDEVDTHTAFGTYAGLSTQNGATELTGIEAALVQGDPKLQPFGPPLEWYTPAAPFWPGGRQLITGITSVPREPALENGRPEPPPELRQVPPG